MSEQGDRGIKQTLSPYPGTTRPQDRNGVNNRCLSPRSVSREPIGSTHTAIERPSSTRHLIVGRPDNNKPDISPPNHYTSAQLFASRPQDRVSTRGNVKDMTSTTSVLRHPVNEIDAQSRRVTSAGDPVSPLRRKSVVGPEPDLLRRDPKPDMTEDHSSFFDRVERPTVQRGGSLLDRLSADDGFSTDAKNAPSPSLRDRLVPSKRSLDEMKVAGGSYKYDLNDRHYEAEEGNESKRARKRGGKNRRPGGDGGGGGRGRRIRS